jgi:hypothetical protein
MMHACTRTHWFKEQSMKKLLAMLALAPAALFFAGCGGGGGGALSQADPDIRLVHGMNGVLNADVFVDNTLGLDDGVFGAASAYAVYGNGNRTVSFRDSTTQGLLAQVTQLFEEETDYTVIGTGPVGAREALVFVDTRESDPVKAKIRIINASSASGTVDVYVTPPATSLTGVAPTADNLSYRRASDT